VQSLKIPQGLRNPNNYTAEEIQAALLGATGSRRFSFRYELLNNKNRVLRELTTVKSGKISQNWLADIKRTATFSLRSGSEDPIDYLRDRIKPIVRLHMPPKALPDPDTVLPPDPPTPPSFAALTDDFSSAEMSDVWTYYANGVSNVGGHLVIPTKPTWPGAATARVWSLLGSHVACEVTKVPTLTDGATDVAVSVVVGSNTAGTNLTIQYRLTGYGTENKMEFLNFHDNYTDATSVSIDYDPDEHKWWRIWESGGTVFWGTSRTGLPGTWQVHRQEPTPAWLTTEAGTLELFVQANGDALGDGGGDYAEIARLNLTPEGVEQPFMPQAEWRNNFNGTPGVTGEVISTNNSARHGNALDDVQGVATYDDTHSADSSKSAKLGDDSGTSGGVLVARLRSALSDWSLRTYFYIPAGGAFSLRPDGPNPSTSNDVTVDDAADVFKLGTATIPAYIRANLVDRLVKLEIITTEALTVYRLFWNDPAGNSPDYVTSESNVNRDALLTVTVAGGGSSTPPVWVDNLLIAEPRTYQRWTDDSVNWVEWPQGVFILSSPQRDTDEAQTVNRDIQGYDLAQVLQDDQVDDRYSTANLLRVNDNFTRETSGSWGTSQDGTIWLQAASTATVGTSLSGYAYCTLNGSPGTIRLFQAGNTARQILTDSEVYTRISVTQTATGGAFLPAIVFRLFSTSRYYRMRVVHNTNGTLSLAATMAATQYGSSVSVGFNYVPGTYVNVRAQCIGHVIRGKVWRDGTPEPAGWMLEEEIDNPDDQIDYGYTGISASAFGDNTNTNPQFRYDLFQLNPNPKNLYTGVVDHILTLADIPKKITPSNAAIPVVKEWEAGTSKREIINDLLAAINYESLSFDEDGYAVVKPYVSPQDRGSEFTYQDDKLSVMYPEVMQELDLFTVPNRWILTVSDPDRDTIVVDFTNADPASPTSTIRRGRTITSFVQEQDADSEATLIEKATRLAFESSQVYEAIEFDTGLMPFHSGNDVYSLIYDALGLNGQYSEVSWDMELSAGAKMSHRARRVISLVAAQDPSIIDDDVEVSGALEAGNIAVGITSITTVANKPTKVVVSGLNLQGRGPVRVIATAESTVPGSTFREVTTADHTPYGFTIYAFRTNTGPTNIHWLAARGA
jgi:hypothetical protein